MEELAKSLIVVKGPAGTYILKKKLINGIFHQNFTNYQKSNSGAFRVMYGTNGAEDVYIEYLEIIMSILKAQR